MIARLLPSTDRIAACVPHPFCCRVLRELGAQHSKHYKALSAGQSADARSLRGRRAVLVCATAVAAISVLFALWRKR